MDINKVSGNMDQTTVNNTISKTKDDEFEKRLKSAMENKDDKELKKVCRDFEAIMLGMMYKQMKATVPKSDLIPNEAGKEIFESMLDEKLVEEATAGAGLGLADALYKQLSKQVKSSYQPDEGNDIKKDVTHE